VHALVRSEQHSGGLSQVQILELAAHGILVVSAIGNDGPLFGCGTTTHAIISNTSPSMGLTQPSTLNNPADMLPVLGVGGLDAGGAVASFSSRGITLHELPWGHGRPKPDLAALGVWRSLEEISLVSHGGGQARMCAGRWRGAAAACSLVRLSWRWWSGGLTCQAGTSVASPVVAGAVTLLASTVPEARRWEARPVFRTPPPTSTHVYGTVCVQTVNPASMKQVLLESADRVPAAAIVEQGAGRLNLLGAYERLASCVAWLI
jgi:membrane-bound transcription factor site-1 protease